VCQGRACGGLEAVGDGDVLGGGARLWVVALSCASAACREMGTGRWTYVGAAGALDEAEGAGGTGPRRGAARLAEAGVIAEAVDDVCRVAACERGQEMDFEAQRAED
jgi:hypothetical protein